MGFYPINLRFPTGELLVSPQIVDLSFDYHPFLRRHLQGDWGDVCADDVQANETALRNHEAILSQYSVVVAENPETLVIMTEWDRSETVILILGKTGTEDDESSP